MDRQDNEALHQKASEHYLQGEYGAALELWRTLYQKAPEDERAAEGIRLCELMSDGCPEPAPDETETDLHQFDLALEENEGEEPGFDLDASILEEMPDSDLPGSNQVHEDAVEEVLLDLDGLPDSSDDPPPEGDDRLDAAAAAELVKRQQELLEEARSARAEGRSEDALGILARLFILDEEHAEGRALETEIQEQTSRAAYEVEDKIAEAVQWMENGRLEDAESNLRQVLDLSPGHQEAEHYLEQVLQRMEQAGAAPEQAEVDPAEAALEHGAVDLDTGGGSEEIALGGMDPDTAMSSEADFGEPLQEVELGGPEAGPEPGAPAPSGSSRGKILIVVAVAVVLAAAGWYFGRSLLGAGGTDPEAAADGSMTRPAGPREQALTERSTADLIQQADALSRDAGEVSRAAADRIPGLVQAADQQMEEADYASAVITWNQVLELDPGHTAARRGIEEAGRRYREYQERSADLVRAGYVFEEGDYSSALKILYRLPEDIQPEKVRMHKVNGWYNLAVISLKAGRIDQALERFEEIRLLEVDDPGAAELEEFARSYRDREKDRSFYQDVNDLTFRSFDGS